MQNPLVGAPISDENVALTAGIHNLTAPVSSAVADIGVRDITAAIEAGFWTNLFLLATGGSADDLASSLALIDDGGTIPRVLIAFKILTA